MADAFCTAPGCEAHPGARNPKQCAAERLPANPAEVTQARSCQLQSAARRTGTYFKHRVLVIAQAAVSGAGISKKDVTWFVLNLGELDPHDSGGECGPEHEDPEPNDWPEPRRDSGQRWQS